MSRLKKRMPEYTTIHGGKRARKNPSDAVVIHRARITDCRRTKRLREVTAQRLNGATVKCDLHRIDEPTPVYVPEGVDTLTYLRSNAHMHSKK